MGKWQRSLYQPVLPLGKDGKRVTGSAEHIALSRKAAGEGMVLVKNENETLPLAKGTKVALFGKGTIDYVKGGGGSGDVTVAYIRNFYEGMKIKEAEGEVSLMPSFSSTADFKPSVTSIFLPVIIKRMMSNSFINRLSRYDGTLICHLISLSSILLAVPHLM